MKTRIEYPNASVFYPGMGVTLNPFMITFAGRFALRNAFSVDLERDRRERADDARRG